MLPSRRAALRIGLAMALVRWPAGVVAALAGAFVLPLVVRLVVSLVVSLERAALVQLVMSLHGVRLDAAALSCSVLGMGIFADWFTDGCVR